MEDLAENAAKFVRVPRVDARDGGNEFAKVINHGKVVSRDCAVGRESGILGDVQQAPLEVPAFDGSRFWAAEGETRQ